MSELELLKFIHDDVDEARRLVKALGAGTALRQIDGLLNGVCAKILNFERATKKKEPK